MRGSSDTKRGLKQFGDAPVDGLQIGLRATPAKRVLIDDNSAVCCILYICSTRQALHFSHVSPLWQSLLLLQSGEQSWPKLASKITVRNTYSIDLLLSSSAALVKLHEAYPPVENSPQHIPAAYPAMFWLQQQEVIRISPVKQLRHNTIYAKHQLCLGATRPGSWYLLLCLLLKDRTFHSAWLTVWMHMNNR